jgi:hypothetical protein
MCRSIRVLRTQPPATREEIDAAARQFVRKVSGFSKPSARNQKAFEEAVRDITLSVERLLDRLPERAERTPVAEERD